jgi:hypothetical protein
LPEFEKAGTQIISEGRFFTTTENDTNQEVCVVGSKIADDFFKVGSPVGQTIKIGTSEFRCGWSAREARTVSDRRRVATIRTTLSTFPSPWLRS